MIQVLGVQELCDLKIEDINLGNNPTVKLHGKGSKMYA